MPEQEQQTEALSLNSFIAILQRRMSVILACGVILPAAALGFSLLQQKEYTATASVLTQDPASSSSSTTDRARIAATNLTLGELGGVADRTARRLRISSGDVSGAVSLSSAAQSDVVRIRVEESSPALSARVANTFAQEYIKLLSSVGTGNAKLVQAAQPSSSPSSPKPLRNTVLAAILGIVLGVLLALLLDRLDRRVRDPREVEAMFDRPILGAIPRSRALSESTVGLPPGEAEAFRMLRANLRYFNIDESVQTVLITSAAPGDGKSTVAWNLAAAAAGAGSRVLLIEADLRHPSLAAAYPIAPMPGLTNVLSGESRLQDVTQRVPIPLRQNGQTPNRTMDVISAGPLPPNPTDLIESDRMAEAIRAAEDLYELVVIDTPPTSIVSDAIPLVTRVSGVIVVSRLGKSIRESLVHLRNQLRNLDAPTLGVVVNALGGTEGGYGYGYSYGYGYAPATGSTNGHGSPDDIAATHEAPGETVGEAQPPVDHATQPPASDAPGRGATATAAPARATATPRVTQASPQPQQGHPGEPSPGGQRRGGLLGRLAAARRQKR